MVAQSTNEAWLSKVKEEALEPDLPICDPHHHLWEFRKGGVQPRYLLDEILADVGGGHNIVSTVFIECGAMFKADGPENYRCVGETEFVNGIAAMSASGSYGKTRVAAGIIGTCDLRIGDAAAGVLDAQIAAGGGRFRGIRRGAFWHKSPDIQNHRTEPPEGLLTHDNFRAGFKHLAPRQLTFEVWCAHTQIPDAISLARAFPDTTLILDHFGGPIGIGPYADKKDEVFAYLEGPDRRAGALPERGCQARRAEHGGQRLRLGAPSLAADQRRAGKGDAALLRVHRRVLRPQPLHVRVELPGRQAELQLYGAVELLQALQQGLLGRRARRHVLRHRRARLSPLTVARRAPNQGAHCLAVGAAGPAAALAICSAPSSFSRSCPKPPAMK